MSVTKEEMEPAITKAVAPLATKDELHEAIANAVAPLATKDELRETENRIVSYVDWKVSSELRHWSNVIIEQLASYIRVLDDKYRHLPDEFRAHVADPKAHDR